MARTVISPLYAALLAASLVTSGCVVEEQHGYASYPRSAQGQARRVYEVQIVQVRPVVLRGESSLAGVAAGGVTGGVLGSFVGSGKAQTLATVGGAIAGAFAGDAIERQATTKRGIEITVRTRSGQTWCVVQTDHGENFHSGEWVRMLVHGEVRTVTR
jgi:outer membrane lipoprotein SlyB